MIRLEDLHLFLRSAALGSFSQAAREADLLPGQVSAAIQRLERELDIRLFARSTRSLRLTEEGERYLPYAQEALQTLREGREGLRSDDAELAGTLQVAAPSDLGRNVLLPWLSEFRRANPRLDLRLLVSDQVTDVFRDPVDIAIRYGRMDDASFIALPLAPDNRRVLVASPDYLRRHGAPQTADELKRHDCLIYQLQGRVYDKWFFPADGGRTIQVGGPLVTDDGDVVRRWAVAGEGIAYKSWLDVGADVRARRLSIVLPQLRGEAAQLHMVCPHRRQYSPAVRQLQALLAARCAALNEDLEREISQAGGA
ncbi:LysR family transcriptional regulator [Herbaspirillum robiniae]|uniref:LysR family transcriptional regulator n=1 Tax=Herbaspirillum robiniae TaxID=2014887 RepID=A0A246WSQ3_9BURK|nr:LysR family transcriptional regulator [Herbaspirillum robiniae]OWY29159.1 LysR family transcriptional regulator [Herbaspirillum robiniae]